MTFIYLSANWIWTTDNSRFDNCWVLRKRTLHFKWPNMLPEKEKQPLTTTCSTPVLILQVVKLFIVLTPRFLSHDQGRLTKELQQHVKSVTHPCEYLRKWLPQHPGLGPMPLKMDLPQETYEPYRGHSAVPRSVQTLIPVQDIEALPLGSPSSANDGSTDLQQTAWRSNRHSQEVMLSIGISTLCAQTLQREMVKRKAVYKQRRCSPENGGAQSPPLTVNIAPL
ncbi:PREDICTED: nuclear pore complex-interacting protein family member A2 [Mandrillus leucophaeus]|uniref:nuclear pore complex-interacting protein family member A2 n=1 Tax=Mandrillus leucophaeus TaxID=9568 RepID=UPI0005F45CFF|nr:PREDICTED: nuclear pore complex-interacting protein family member A2 [Mandrillus leucophaeus]